MHAQAIQVTTSTFGTHAPELLPRITTAGFEVRLNPYGRRLTKPEAIDLFDVAVVGVLAGLEPLDRDVLSGSSLKVVSRVGSGLANVDLEAAADLGITVCSTPDGPTTAVAELTLGALLSLLRNISDMNVALHNGEWSKIVGRELRDRKVAVLGLGRIGSRVAELCLAFGATVYGIDPTPFAVPPGVVLSGLEQALDRVDVLCVHASGEDCLIGATEIARMPPGSLLLNASRGGVVGEEAVRSALQSGHLGGAWLDVFVDEPYTGPLAHMSETLLTPHVGSYTQETRRRMETLAVDNLLAELTRLYPGGELANP